jgi:hypothetical protein
MTITKSQPGMDARDLCFRDANLILRASSYGGISLERKYCPLKEAFGTFERIAFHDKAYTPFSIPRYTPFSNRSKANSGPTLAIKSSLSRLTGTTSRLVMKLKERNVPNVSSEAILEWI